MTITLEYNGGSSKAFSVTVNPLSQVIWNVNANSTGAGSSQSVSAEITSSGAQIAVEREMYFGYDHVGDGRTTTATGGSDVLGQVGPAAKGAYSFAEGYTNLGYDEWLTIQNPTATTETVNVTVSNGVGTVYTFAEQVVGHSRSTVDMVAIVQQHVFHGGNGYPGYEISSGGAIEQWTLRRRAAHVLECLGHPGWQRCHWLCWWIVKLFQWGGCVIITGLIRL